MENVNGLQSLTSNDDDDEVWREDWKKCVVQHDILSRATVLFQASTPTDL